jgi:hypothetical protein
LRAESQFYSVQPLLPDGEKDGGIVTTDAISLSRLPKRPWGKHSLFTGR